MLLKKIYCRMFQACFGLGARVLPWRRPECITGLGSFARVPSLLAERGVRKPLIVASRRQSQTPAFQEMLGHLAGWSLYTGVTANPRVETVEAIAAQYRRSGCDGFVAVGGGSPMDAAKAAAALIARPGRTVAQLGGLLKVRCRVPPLVAVPTTAGTGSETTIAAVVTGSDHHKYAINDLCLIPQAAVLDPALSASLPQDVTAQTGMDALTHAVEAYIGRFYNTAETRRMAERAVAGIFRHLPEVCRDGGNLGARQAMLAASYQAGFAFTRAGVGNVHAIAHTLGGLYDVGHGLANAVLLPVVLEDYGPAVYRRLARLAEAAGLPGEDDAQKANAFIAAIRAMNQQFRIPEGFSCIREADLPQMAAWADAEANPTYPVPVIYDRAHFIRVIRRVMLPAKREEQTP